MSIFKKIGKLFLAGITAIVILCILLTPYASLPVHIDNPQGNTDYVWPANSLWCKMTEGISYGCFDAKGFNNVEVVNDPDILILGSSHTEATDVLQSENFSALLGKEYEGVYTTYNMGISGHSFIKVCKYLPKSTELNRDAKYIIIETSDVSFNKNDIDSLLNGTIEHAPSNSSGLIGALQRLPFPRIVYQQLAGGMWDMLIDKKATSDAPSTTPTLLTLEETLYDPLFNYIGNIMQDSTAQLIVMYHPSYSLQQDGSLSFKDNDTSLAMFSSKCQQYGIAFVDMTEAFLEMYATEHKLPHGFITGKIGSGHLNADGHKIIAEELATCISTLEGGD